MAQFSRRSKRANATTISLILKFGLFVLLVLALVFAVGQIRWLNRLSPSQKSSLLSQQPIGHVFTKNDHQSAQRYCAILAHSSNDTTITRDPSTSSLARMIIFQRDGGFKLQRLINHYLQVLDPHDLVIIDHLGKDPFTKSLLHEYHLQGVQLWQCHGPWEEKHAMWSHVTRFYGNNSQFVFPIDVDEFLVTYNENEAIEWSKSALQSALAMLEHKGWPFKLMDYQSIPLDCGTEFTNTKNNILPSEVSSHGKQHRPQCHVKVKRLKTTCMSKTFARGTEFSSTDQGNHFGGTKKLGKDPSDVYRTCRKQGVDKVYQAAPHLGLIHLSTLSFNDWLTHTLRGAGDYGYNTPGYECSKLPVGIHYCKGWQELYKMRFNMWEMQEAYHQQACPHEPINASWVDFPLPDCFA